MKVVEEGYINKIAYGSWDKYLKMVPLTDIDLLFGWEIKEEVKENTLIAGYYCTRVVDNESKEILNKLKDEYVLLVRSKRKPSIKRNKLFIPVLILAILYFPILIMLSILASENIMSSKQATAFAFIGIFLCFSPILILIISNQNVSSKRTKELIKQASSVVRDAKIKIEEFDMKNNLGLSREEGLRFQKENKDVLVIPINKYSIDLELRGQDVLRYKIIYMPKEIHKVTGVINGDQRAEYWPTHYIISEGIVEFEDERMFKNVTEDRIRDQVKKGMIKYIPNIPKNKLKETITEIRKNL